MYVSVSVCVYVSVYAGHILHIQAITTMSANENTARWLPGNESQVIRRHLKRRGPGRKVSASRRTVPRGRGTLCLHTATPLVAGVHCVPLVAGVHCVPLVTWVHRVPLVAGVHFVCIQQQAHR